MQVEGGALFGLTAVNLVTLVRVSSSLVGVNAPSFVVRGDSFNHRRMFLVLHRLQWANPARNPKTVEREARNVKWREKMKRYKYAD